MLIVCLLWGTHYLWGQLSTQHYIPPVPDLVFEDAYLYVSTPHPNVTFTLKPVGGLESSWVSQTIDNANSAKIPLTVNEIPILGQVSVDPSFFTNNHVYDDIGYVLTADREVYVSLRLKTTNHAGALVSKGVDGLGKSFRVGGMERKEEYVPFVAFGDWSFFSIMATKDATIVNFEDVDPLLVAENLNGSLPASITLDESETYLALFNGQNNERFIGTHVKSQNHDIIVNSGSIIGSFSDEILDPAALPDGLFMGETTAYLNGSDMGFDQMVSLDRGVDANEYLLIKGDGFDSIENALVIANEPNTAIYLNGGSTVYTTLVNAGDHVFIEGNEFVSGGGIGYLQISGDKNIYVFQGTGKKGADINGAGTIHWYGANQGMFFVPPLSCASVGDVQSIARIDEVDDAATFFGSLFVISTGGSTVEVDGLDINDYPSVQTVGGITADSRTYQVHRVDNLLGDVSVVGSEELYVSYYNYNGNATSGAFYSGFALEPRIYPEITLDALGVCFDPVNGTNVTLNLPNSTNYDGWKWQKQDTTGAWNDILSGASDPDTYIPTEYGIYRVEVNINCLAPSNIIYSDPLTVSVCPPDFDSDGVVNNIDLDNDNDGVLDAVESYGNFEVDLTLSPPQINAPGVPSSDVPVLQQTITTPNGVFTPFTDGRFTSFLPTASLTSNETLVYKLSPSMAGAVHLKFSLSGPIPTESDVSYVLESIDPSESITLLNPSDELELLMNGVYISGQTQFNGSKIEFRFNTAIAGTDPADFSFMVYNTSGLKFTHVNLSTANTTTFNGVFEVINLDRLSDGDVSPDIFDADSDGDNCPDVLEAGFIDGDNDEKVLVGPLTFDDGTVDSRGRVIGHDYTQTPADNDANGVYDFQEFGSITIGAQPVDTTHCDGDSALFQVTSNGTYYQWQVWDASGMWTDLSDGGGYSGTTTYQLQIDNLSTGLNATEYRVAIWNDALVCPEFSDPAKLEVVPLPAAPILSSSKFGFCIDDSPTVGGLMGAIASSVLVYDSSTATSPLATTDLLNAGTYHVSAIDVLGCESTNRTEVEVIIEEILLEESNILHQECDQTDGVLDLKVLTNLRAFEPTISANHTHQQFGYFYDATHTNPLPDPSNHINVDPSDGITPLFTQTIYIKIESVFDSDVLVVGSCEATAEIVLETSLSQIPTSFNTSFYACESGNPAEIDGKTSFNASIFSDLNTDLLAIPVFAAQPNLVIRYYGSEADAQDKVNPIQTSIDYMNQNPVADGNNWTDEIWANISVEASGSFTCFGFAKVATLYIERLPIAHPIDALKVCDNDNDATNLYPFDTSTVNSQLLMGQTGVAVSFWDTSGNLLYNDALPNPYNAPSQTLIARVENNPSLNTPACYEERSFGFVIDDAPGFYPVSDFILCDDSDGLIDNAAIFDTRNLEADILNGQVGMEVFYYDPLGNALSAPLPEDFKTGTIDITVEIVNPANPSCPATGVVSFVVNENPDFGLDFDTVLCLNEVSMTIGISNPADTYAYTWELDGTPLPDVTEEIEIFQGGTYSITATSAEGCTTTKSIFVLESELAQLSQGALIVSDLTPNSENTVSVDVTMLGVGEYEYSLDYGLLQDSPTFENVRPGIHVLSVRDINGCGTAYIDLSVIGYYKYFSPNNDGINDYWKVLGIDGTFYNSSKVYIFDRYGRLLSQLQNDSPGWDGYFKGSPMPADDYWFRVELDDGRAFDGHFSLMR